MLVGIISLISICLAYSICFNTEATSFNWQKELINLSQNVINIKNYLLFISAFLIFFKEKESNYTKNKDTITTTIGKIPIVFIALYVILIAIMIFCFDRGEIGGKYLSNTNAIYEYAIVIYAISWIIYSKNKAFKIALLVYAIAYIAQGLLFGDRSSAFPMIIFLLIENLPKKVKLLQIAIIGMIGIIIANSIDILRNNGYQLSVQTAKDTISRGLFVNTITYSYYAGTQIIRYGDSVPEQEKIFHFAHYNASYITGGGGEYDLSLIANNNGYTNARGGMISNYLYFWGGYLSTIIISIIICLLLNNIYSHTSSLHHFLQCCIIAFSIRWIIYYPISLFRTSIIIPSILYALLYLFSKLISKRKISNER